MDRVKGKTALVTGAAQGIGKAITELLIQEGATVIITDVLKTEGEKVALDLGHSACFYPLDVAHEEEWQAVTQLVKSQFGKLDILVNNAGIMGLTSHLGPLDPENSSLESWHYIHAVNLDGTFLGCKYGIALMKDQGGSIINVSSRSGVVGIPSAAAYASSKAAIRNHTKTVALYCAEKGYNIRCNAVLPAAILTPLWNNILGEDEEKRQRSIAVLAGGIPLKRMGDPMDVAYAVLYLASSESGYLTGTDITIDGGILAGSAASPKSI
jgi:NAD(P)-dependent dehydrogenase (short-subunit alcohol dehydrogenase family)